MSTSESANTAEPAGSRQRPAPTAPGWPPPEDGRTKYPINMPLSEDIRIIGRQTLDADGRLISFSLAVEKKYQDRWSPMARMDSADDEVHIHYFDRATGDDVRRESLWPITCHQDVERGYVEAEERLTDYGVLEWIERRWASGH